MKAKNVHVGDVYAVKVSGKIAEVKIDFETLPRGWVGTNLATGRTVLVKTAARLRYNVTLKTAADEYYAARKAGVEPPPAIGRTTSSGDYDGTKYAEPRTAKTKGWY